MDDAEVFPCRESVISANPPLKVCTTPPSATAGGINSEACSTMSKVTNNERRVFSGGVEWVDIASAGDRAREGVLETTFGVGRRPK